MQKWILKTIPQKQKSFIYLKDYNYDILKENDKLEVAGDINMDYVLKRLSNNDNEIEDVYKDGAEYIIKIRIWNGTVCYLKTIQCRSIIYNDDLVSEFGDIIFDNGSYKFMTFDDEEVILEIIADEILEVDR